MRKRTTLPTPLQSARRVRPEEGFHRNGATMPTQPADSRPAYQAAYDELTRIQRRHDPEQGRWKDYYRLVIDCLRRFLEQQHDVRTTNRSVAEMRRALRHSSIAPAQAQSLLALWAENEAIQTATYLPGLAQGRQLTGRARTLIEQTARPSAG